MASRDLGLPSISAPALSAFARYTRWYLARHFHSLRIARRSAANELAGRPLIICLNHPSWWDPLVCLTLSRTLFPTRTHYAPIDSAALTKYRFFERLGFFGIDPKGVSGAARFLEIGREILRADESALWITAQGSFADPRRRPTQLRPGVGHLIRSAERVAVLPVALEYAFWTEKRPEALVRLGEPLLVTNGRERTPTEWTAEVAGRLETAQDRLADDSILRRSESFDVLLRGGTGVSFAYDAWRRLRGRVSGERLTGAHGEEL